MLLSFFPFLPHFSFFSEVDVDLPEKSNIKNQTVVIIIAIVQMTNSLSLCLSFKKTLFFGDTFGDTFGFLGSGDTFPPPPLPHRERVQKPDRPLPSSLATLGDTW
jgi:hypothetical protein